MATIVRCDRCGEDSRPVTVKAVEIQEQVGSVRILAGGSYDLCERCVGHIKDELKRPPVKCKSD